MTLDTEEGSSCTAERHQHTLFYFGVGVVNVWAWPAGGGDEPLETLQTEKTLSI